MRNILKHYYVKVKLKLNLVTKFFNMGKVKIFSRPIFSLTCFPLPPLSPCPSPLLLRVEDPTQTWSWTLPAWPWPAGCSGSEAWSSSPRSCSCSWRRWGGCRWCRRWPCSCSSSLWGRPLSATGREGGRRRRRRRRRTCRLGGDRWWRNGAGIINKQLWKLVIKNEAKEKLLFRSSKAWKNWISSWFLLFF